MTPAREKKYKDVIGKRQKTLSVVLENVDDPHNIGAILRSCDAFGIYDVHLLYTNNRPPRIREMRSKSAASATKWLRLTKWTKVSDLVAHLKKDGFWLAVTKLGARTKDISKADLTVPVAIAIGNEHAGISKELAKAADMHLKIPMRGFVQSFNVSVAAAIVLYEAIRQRDNKKGNYAFTKKEQDKLVGEWS